MTKDRYLIAKNIIIAGVVLMVIYLLIFKGVPLIKDSWDNRQAELEYQEIQEQQSQLNTYKYFTPYQYGECVMEGGTPANFCNLRCIVDKEMYAFNHSVEERQPTEYQCTVLCICKEKI
ncbi:hypothetical protein ACFL96_07455 [Thermoproteota archaeon]